MVTIPTYFGTQRAYQIVRQGANAGTSDSINGGYTNSGSFGLFLPDIGVILLNAQALDNHLPNLNFTTGSADANSPGNNPARLFQSLLTGSQFGLNSEETITSDFIFVRTRNSEFNYSENPSYISGSTGEVIYDYFINNPQTYITTVGMYNDSNELLAVAKLSKPLNKDFTKEALVRVKLDF